MGLSHKLVEMLRSIPKEGERIFSHYKNLKNLRRSFERYRVRAAHKLGNPRLRQITFHTLAIGRALWNTTRRRIYFT